jgi:pimeloyl-ACP methyl ester carboxylesterase
MTARRRVPGGWRVFPRGITLGLVAVAGSAVLSACGSAPKLAPGTASVVSAPVRTAHTRLGAVGYRVVGSGPPLVLIMGYAWNMEGWDPRLVHALARHNRVVMFDNTGVGRTQELPSPVSIDSMADQTSALIETLHLGRPDVLVLSATYPGTGAAAAASQAARQTGSLFPANQSNAGNAFKAAVAEYPSAPATSGTNGPQALAMGDWLSGLDAAGLKTARISAPTLIADGTDDQLDPVANDHALARLIPGSKLVLYRDAGHGFMFQDRAPFAAQVDSFLAGHPSP